jgi:hypothetical protein
MRLQKHEKGTILELCFRRFERGFTDEEIVKEMGFKLGTVKNYRFKHYSTVLDSFIYESKLRKHNISFEIMPDHKNEMNYGSDLPKYKWQELDPTERKLTKQKNHEELKQLNKKL